MRAHSPQSSGRSLVAAALLSLAALGAPSAPLAAQGSATPALVGRWDLRVTGPAGQYPSWLEVTRSGHATYVGRYVGAVGSARPISRIDVTATGFQFAIPRQWEQETNDLRVEGRVEGDRMTGTLVTPGGQRHTWTAVRAPTLRRATAPSWGTPIPLFDGRDKAGWRVFGGADKWTVVNGILTNAGGGGNLATERTFDDFRLLVEFRYPRGSNSGIYLRGRYEVQIEDPAGKQELGPHDIGGVYGLLSPNENAARAPGEWQTYEITLVGRRVTVVLNGKPVIADQVIPGITGGALDSDEAAPGPFYIQGDHGPVEFRRIVLTPARGD